MIKNNFERERDYSFSESSAYHSGRVGNFEVAFSQWLNQIRDLRKAGEREKWDQLLEEIIRFFDRFERGDVVWALKEEKWPSLSELASLIDSLIKVKQELLQKIEKKGADKITDEESNKVKELQTGIRKVGRFYLKQKYLISSSAAHKSVAELLSEMGNNEEVVKKFISVDRQGKVRFKNPDQSSLPGVWEDEEAIKALLIGVQQAKMNGDPARKVEFMRDVYRYVGIPFPEGEISEGEIGKTIEDLKGKLINKFGRLKRWVPLVIFLLTLLVGGERDNRQRGEKVQDGVHQEKVEPSQAERKEGGYQTVYSLTAEDKLGIGSVTIKMLGALGMKREEYSDDQLYQLIRQLAQDNNIEVEELGIKEGDDDETLPVGREVILTEKA